LAHIYEVPSEDVLERAYLPCNLDDVLTLKTSLSDIKSKINCAWNNLMLSTSGTSMALSNNNIPTKRKAEFIRIYQKLFPTTMRLSDYELSVSEDIDD